MNAMAFVARPRQQWQLRTRTLALGEQTRVLGIVNCTPDSFSGDGRKSVEEAVAHALRQLDEGACGVDLGGESTRPGSDAGTINAISADEEQDRVLPVLEGLLRERPDALVSVDTYRGATASAAIAAGAEIVNDVSGLAWDPHMAAICAGLACGVILMHTHGRPNEWRTQPTLMPEHVVPLVRAGLAASLQLAAAAEIAGERVVLDPGYGFGKISTANYVLLAGQPELLSLGRPLLAGVSRKSFLGQTLAARGGHGAVPPQQRDHATAAASVAAVLAGASLLRVHAVGLVVEAAAIADAVLRGATGAL